MLGRPIPTPRAPWVFSEIGGHALDLIGAFEDWDEERWIGPDRSVLAYVHSGHVVGLATVDGALAPSVARQLVDDRVALDEVAAAR